MATPMERTTVSVGHEFGIKGAENVRMSSLKEGHAWQDFVPEKKQHVFGASLGDFHVWMEALEDPLMIQGPTGCGKSSCITQVAARTNRPLFRVNAHNRTEWPDFAGQLRLVDGSTEFQHGPLAQAMKIGAWFLVDELDLAQPGILASLNTVLEGGALTIPENGGEVIKPARGFRFIATCNSKGDGGASTGGAYSGVMRQNVAFLDRFMVLEETYLPHSHEVGMLVAMATPEDIAQRMVSVANATRDSFLEDGCTTPISTRSLIRWATLIPCYKNKPEPAFYALERAFLKRVGDRETIDAVKEFCISHGLVMGA